jgi:anaerobic magnesium-protoporphyrin IX monomethyl ester cyclase
MKVLFVSKPFFIEPLGIMYLSSAAKREGHSVELALTNENLEEKINLYKPDLVGYSVISGDQNFYLDLNKKLKEKFNFFSIFGGPHPTFFPELINEQGVDSICVGEGEGAFIELINSFDKKDSIKNIKNLYIKENSKIIKNEVRPFLNIDSINFPDRELVSNVEKVGNGPIRHFIASRGCPFSCSYCFNEKYSYIYSGKGERVRFRNIDSLIEEISQTIKDHPTKFVYFQDDTFTLSKEWLKEFSKKYSEEINLPFHCHVRPNTINEEKISHLKNAGCYSVHIAAETADDYLRNQLLKRGMSKKKIFESAELLKKYNIKFMMQNIIGLPEGSIDKDFETLELNIKCKPNYAWVSIFQPYPGTRLGDYCKEKGYYTGNFNDLANNFFESSKLNFSEEYKTQLSNLQKLFAIFVEYPEIHYLGLSKIMINLPDNPKTKNTYQEAYKNFRKKADTRLYGFDL